MDKYEIIRRIEKFAPPENAEHWDCSGWIVETAKNDIKKIMLALTVTEDVIHQAKEADCDMVISHHPLFVVPFNYSNIDIYSAHTNLDLAPGGTTDTLIEYLGLKADLADGFLRYVNFTTDINEFILKLKTVSKNIRLTNNKNIKILNKIAFCAGSGSEFIEKAYKNGADALVTGDIKFHTALDSSVVLFDIGHFESEIQVLKVFEQLIGDDVQIVYAKEKSPFTYLSDK